ncbi:hypothetical protein LFM09_34165 [Lentzea alba]|uniref:hypothetical protein n=1 Tax=Lentzea TaxID=165301 RepID=UPI000DD37400|nr:hypothetical protein [Lentzea terrae]
MPTAVRPKETTQAEDEREQVVTHTLPSLLPSPEHLAYFAGLGVLALFGLLEWPVTVAIGTGVLVAERMARKEKPATEHTPAERTSVEQ